MASTVWRGNIAFGLVSIPVRLVRAARRERIQFRQVYRPSSTTEPAESSEDAVDAERPAAPLSRVAATSPMSPLSADAESVSANIAPLERVHYTAAATREDGSVVERVRPDQIVKGFEVEPNRYVTFQREEVKALKPETSTSMEIGSFIHSDTIDPLYFDASYYVVPQPAGEKPYALLFSSLKETGYAGLGSMAMHGREHAVVIRPGAQGLILQTLFFQNEVHLEDQHAADTQLPTAAEQKMAGTFIKALAAEFNADELVDKYEARLKALIEERKQAAPAAPAPKKKETAPVVDIMEALRQSLAQVRKPTGKETRKGRKAS